MRQIAYLPLLAVGLLGFGVAAHAAPDTATQLRLQSIEARLPDADAVAKLQRQVAQLKEQVRAGTPAKSSIAEPAGAAAPAAAGGSQLFSLLQDIQGMKEKLRQQRGRIDQLQHQLEKNKKRQRTLYQNLDKRLRALEGGGAAPTQPGAAGAVPAAPVAGQQTVEAAYESARALLQSGKYTQASQAFRAFLDEHPRSQYSGNAWYWLGMIDYVNRDFDESAASFKHVLHDFPDHNKVPGSLYKLGVIRAEQGKTDKARTLLRKVVGEYPGSNAAKLAAKRLQVIGSNGG